MATTRSAVDPRLPAPVHAGRTAYPQPLPRRSWLTLLASAGAALAFSGCAYRVGPSSGVEPGSKSVAIQPFENQSLEPRVTEAIQTALRGQLQQEGTFELARKGDADIVVSGVVQSIDRQEQSFQSRDTRTTRDYRFDIRAQVTATERGTGRKLVDQVVEGHTMLRVLQDLPSAERQAMPLLAANLARNIVSLLVDGSW
jgi:hypothetical protein